MTRRRLGTRRSFLGINGGGPPPTPQAMYFIGTTGGLSWSDASYWYSDVGGTIPAGRIPINGDTITCVNPFADTAPTLSIKGFSGVGPPLGAYQTAALTVSSTGAISINTGYWGGTNLLGCTGNFTGDSIQGGDFIGDCTLTDTAQNQYQISGTGYFDGTAFNAATGSIYTPYFAGYSYNAGSFADATFTQSSYNEYLFGGNTAVFWDNSINYGYLSLGATFYDYTSNGTTGDVQGYGATFHGGATTHAGYLGYGEFYDYSSDYGSTYSGYYNGFSSTQYGNITGYGYWGDNTSNSGENYYQASFSGASVNLYLCDATSDFYGYSYNDGTVSGAAAFYDFAENASAGIIGGDGTFNNSSKNYGLVSSNGYFYDSSDQLGTVMGTTTCSTTGTCP